MTCACTDTSRAETGSSATISLGSTDSARAMPMRWRWPPENSCGYFVRAAAGRPTAESSSRSRFFVAAPSVSSPCARIPSASSDSTDWRGSRLLIGSWKTIWNSLRRRRSSSPFRVAMSVPSTMTLPSVGGSRLRIALPRVDLPQPDSPTRP